MMRTLCGCEFPDQCNGSGFLECDGCGGDICVCKCGGMTICPGCEYCEDADFAEEDEDEEDD